jgi:uncharacterized membrane protein
MENKDTFATLTAIITAAVGTVSAVFLLFNSFFKNLVPPINDAQLPIGMVSLSTTIILLGLTLLIRSRLSKVKQLQMTLISLALVVAALIAFFLYRDYFREYVYEYPAQEISNEAKSIPVIRGEFHENGLIRAKGMSIQEAVRKFGGPELVERKEILWSEKSKNMIVSRLEKFYVLITMLLSTALFIVALTVIRATKR